MPSILIVDDDASIREVIRYALARDGFAVREASRASEAERQIALAMPDLVVLDVMMPEMDGLEFCRRLRRTSDVPVLFLSSRGEELDRVVGLELGGDDYLAKPFSPRELVSRVKAVLRRARPSASSAGEPGLGEVFSVGDVRLDVDAHRVTVAGVEVPLTATEFRLLQALMARPGRVFARDELMSRAYDGAHFVSDRTLDSHVRGVRSKLRECGADPIETVHGVGYRLAAS
jgi:two-component system OmpR family response regulator